MSTAKTSASPQPSSPGTTSASEADRERGLSYWEGVSRRLRKDYVTIVAIAIITAIVLSAIFAPLIAPYDPYVGGVLKRMKPIGFEGHLLGTDESGRDMLSRLLYAGRISLISGILPVLGALMIGGTIGVIAGFSERLVNAVIMRITDVFFAFPSILLAIAIVGLLGTGLTNTLLSLCVVFIPQIIRVAESVTVQVKTLDFVAAARVTGARTSTILFRQVLPNVLSPILVYATSLVSLSMILAAGLSFLGLGVSPPTAEWGLMLNSLRQAIYFDPMLAALPGVFIFIVSLCFNLVSDGLRQAMDVRIKL